jgi:FlaA1/EpsC-like NDP-sugar epimerase
MGQPIKIIDLAKRMIQLAGLTLRTQDNPNGDIDIELTGLRPGEKLYEELLIGDNPEMTVNARIMKANEDFVSWSLLSPRLVALRLAAIHNDQAYIKDTFSTLVHGYSSLESQSS